jgi:hypothetical protein
MATGWRAGVPFPREATISFSPSPYKTTNYRESKESSVQSFSGGKKHHKLKLRKSDYSDREHKNFLRKALKISGFHAIVIHKLQI